MTEFKIEIIKADWSDKNTPMTTTITAAKFDDGTEGIYFLDLIHGVRIWVSTVGGKT
jgi:hypothetical protein